MLKVPNACSLWALEEKIEQLISSNTASLILVFKSLLFYVIIVFLSFRFIHWTQYSPADPSISSLYQLNLRGNAVTQLISAPAARRRRRRSLRRRKRQVPLSSVQLTAAIVLDPFTNSLLVSDASSGNILSCNTTSSPVQCNVAVDSSQLTGAPSGGKHVQFPLFVGHFDIYLQIPCSAHLLCLFIYRCLALPAIRIAVDETRIYWTSNSTMGVHYVLKSDTPSVAVETIPSNTTAGILLSTSPGLQQLPGNGSKSIIPRARQCRTWTPTVAWQWK